VGMPPGWPGRGRPTVSVPWWYWWRRGPSNEAANGLAGSDTALGVLPGGSTNVFAGTIGMANDPIEATSQLLSALAAGSIERVGPGPGHARYFLFHAGIAFDAAVVARVEKLAPLKRYTGPAVFRGGHPAHLGPPASTASTRCSRSAAPGLPTG